MSIRNNKKVIFGKEIDFSIYDRIFCLDKRQIVVDVVMLLKKRQMESVK